ncbi:MAG: F-type H+-transporting ATPase subunit gamma [Planctomycetota bacterium]|jgi:F-type H+-transporting ATPase subunit gamma
MSNSIASLRHKIHGAGDLKSVVRTMKAIAASSIGQYENAVHSLDEYYRTVQLGLCACLRQNPSSSAYAPQTGQKKTGRIGAIIFGSDQGLVGQFNDVVVEFAVKSLEKLSGEKALWAVGERIHSSLTEMDLSVMGNFILPNSMNAITPLVGRILSEIDLQYNSGSITEVYLFYNRPQSGSIYTSVVDKLLPLDETWRRALATSRWPTPNLPEVINDEELTLRALVREYLFVTIFRACAESLASENASRLAAMQRAEKNIEELQEDLNRTYHRLRQSDIDEELFDVVSGFEALRVSG